MVELINKPSRKNRGIVVKMRFLHNKRSQNEKTTTKFWYKYFKWLLWLSLTSYFFTSFLITRSPNPIKPLSFSLSKSSVPLALTESQKPLSHQGTYQYVCFLFNFKVFRKVQFVGYLV